MISEGSKKIAINVAIVVVCLLIGFGMGNVFVKHSKDEDIKNDIETNALEKVDKEQENKELEENNKVIENAKENSSENKQEVENKEESNKPSNDNVLFETEEEANLSYAKNNHNAQNNIVNNKPNNSKPNNNVHEETYFQEFFENVTKLKAWEKLNVSWTPTEFIGAIVPTKIGTKKPELVVTKKTNKENVTTGDIITYTISVKNIGNNVAKKVEIKDIIDTKYLEVVSKDINFDKETNEIKVLVGDIKVNEEKEISFDAKVKEVSDEEVLNSKEIKILNTATAIAKNSNEAKSNEVENSYLKPIIDVTKVAKVGENNVAKAGDKITYTVTIENKGTLEKVVAVEDTLPVMLENIKLLDHTNELKIDNNKIVGNIKVAAKGKEIVTYEAIVKEDAKGTILNNVKVDDNEEAKTATPIIVFNKKADKTVVTTGDVITYTIEVTNTSKVDAKNVVITDEVPVGTELLYLKDINFKIDVPAGKTEKVSFEVKVKENDLNTIIKNVAKVDGKDTNEVEIQFVKPVINVTKTSDKTVVKSGDKITYTVVVKNDGTLAKVVNIKDKLPTQLGKYKMLTKVNGVKIINKELIGKVKVEAGETLEIKYQGTVKMDAKGTIKNAVKVDGDEEKITETPVIIFNKKVDKTVATTEDILTYTIEVTNTSTVDANGVVIKDIVPEGTELVGTEKPEWTVNVPAGQTVTKIFKVKVLDNKLNTIIKNVATVDGKNTNEVETEFVKPVINVVKSTKTKVAKVGDIVKYTIKITNDGTLEKVVALEDTLPAGLEKVKILNNIYNLEIKDGKIKGNVKVAEKSNVVIEYTGVVKTETTGTLVNSVKVDNGEEKTTNTPVITFRKEVDKKVATVGEELTYTIFVKNTSTTEIAENVKVEDAAPAGTKLVKGQKTSWTLTLQPNQEVKLSFKVIVEDTDNLETVIKNTATVDGKNTNEVETKFVKPVINVVKSTETKVAKVGDTVKYTIKITNDGTLAKDVVVKDTLPVHLKDIVLLDHADELTVNDGEIVGTVHVPAGKDVIINYQGTVAEKAEGLLLNTVKVDDDKQAQTETPIITFSKSAVVNTGKDYVTTGDEITYTITVENKSNVDANEVVIRDTVPAGTKLLNDKNEVVEGRELTWTINVKANTTETVSFRVKVSNNDLNTKITNVATVNGKNTNEVETEFVKPIINAIKQVCVIENNNEVGNKLVKVGDVLRYKIVVSNTGDMEGKATITDTIPTGTKLVSKIMLGSKEYTVEQLNSGIVTTIAKNSSKTLTFDVEVLNTADQFIKNTANVNGTNTDEVSTERLYKYKVEYYTQKQDESGYDHRIELDYSEEVQLGSIIEGYRQKPIPTHNFERVENSPLTIVKDESKNVIKVYYNLRKVGYRVEYYQDNLDNKIATEIPTSKHYVGKLVNEELVNKDLGNTWINAHKPAGYKDGEVQGYITLVNDENQNVIKVLYTVRTDIEYTVKYFYNGKEEPQYSYTKQDATLNEMLDFNNKVEQQPVYNNETWTLDNSATKLPYQIKPENNIINVYYVKAVIKKPLKSANINIVKPEQEIIYTITTKNEGGLAKVITITDKVPTSTEFVSADDGKTPNEKGEISWTQEIKPGETIQKHFIVKVNKNVSVDTINNIAVVDGQNTNEVITNIIYDNIEAKFISNEKQVKAKNIVMVLDLSSSMYDKINKITKLSSAKQAAKNFIDNIYKSTNVKDVNISFITFNLSDNEYKNDYIGTKNLKFGGSKMGNIDIVTNYNQAQILKESIDNISLPEDYQEEGMGTHIKAALSLANKNLNSFKKMNNNENVVVFLGDGEPTEAKDYGKYGDYTDNTLKNIKLEAKEIRQKSTFYTISFGMGENGSSLLKTISTDKCAYTANNQDELLEAFKAIEESQATAEEKIILKQGQGSYTIPTTIKIDTKNSIIIKTNLNNYTLNSIEDINKLDFVKYNSNNKTFTFDCRGKGITSIIVKYNV